MRAFVFPGQGAQAIGMGKELADAYPAARAVFEAVDDALGEKLSALIWEGSIEDLTLTRNAQPALMATSLAAMAALQAEGISVTAAAYVAGHSLGEYSALCAAGALSLADTARLLRIRGDAMQAAVPVGIGAMAALLGMDFDAAREVAAEAAQGEVCEAANDNDPGQVVVSGHRAAVERAVEIAKARGAKRALILPVSAPFHSSLMAPAAAVMAQALDGVTMSAPAGAFGRQCVGGSAGGPGADQGTLGAAGDGISPLAGISVVDGRGRCNRGLGDWRGQGPVRHGPPHC